MAYLDYPAMVPSVIGDHGLAIGPLRLGDHAMVYGPSVIADHETIPWSPI